MKTTLKQVLHTLLILMLALCVPLVMDIIQTQSALASKQEISGEAVQYIPALQQGTATTTTSSDFSIQTLLIYTVIVLFIISVGSFLKQKISKQKHAKK